ncbi:MAG: hypothetical protein WB763_05415 [Terriglobia bacterium]
MDSHVQNEGNGWAGSDANPWHLDDDTESILFLTNESDQPARLGFKVSAHGVIYEVAEKGQSTVILIAPRRDAILTGGRRRVSAVVDCGDSSLRSE